MKQIMVKLCEQKLLFVEHIWDQTIGTGLFSSS